MMVIEDIVLTNCRLCHRRPGAITLTAEKQLIEQIRQLLQMEMEDETALLLPSRICGECKTTLGTFNSFRNEVHNVDQILRGLLKNTAIESQSKDGNRFLYDCRRCPATFEAESILKNHLKSHISTYKCDICKKEYKCKNYFEKHTCSVNTSCDTCRSTFKTKTEFETHQCTIKPDRVLENEIKNDFLTKSGKSEPKFVCTINDCGKVCGTAYLLKIHIRKHDEKLSYLCVICGKGFATRNSLVCHEKIHLKTKGYVCKICNLGFSVRSNLRAHEKKHHEGVRFYCSQCTRMFSAKACLERHERIHAGIKEFQCETCPSAFYTNKELVKHRRYHQGLRTHKCEQCFKTFFERHHLTTHLRSHTGERPYVCPISGCGKSYAERQKLKRHHKAKHSITI